MSRRREVVMSGPAFELSEILRAGLRATVGAIDKEIARVQQAAATEGGRMTIDELCASRAELVNVLARGFQRAVHVCPACGRIMAEVCGESVVEQSWFWVRGPMALCPGHRSTATRGEGGSR